MSTGHDPVDDLVLLLSNHSLPEQIDYDSNSTGSTMVSASVVDKISTCLLQSSPQLSRGLQNVLVLYASLLAPTHQPAVGITRASRVDTIESGERYAISTREAQEAALAEMISGELGESHYIMVHLIHPLNLHLRRMLLGTGLNVYWRFVGHGPAGKPDIELVYDPSTPRVRRCLIKLAVCEIKSELALPNRLVADIISGVTNRQLKMAGNVVVERGQEHVPRELRAKRCKITEQALGEMFTRDVNFAVITNYSRSFLLRRTPGQHLGVEHVIELMDTAVNVEYRVDITKLWNSPLGLLLGVTFLAIVDKGIPLGAGAEADEEQGGLQVDARNSSETVRPHLGEMGVMGGAGIGAQGAPGGSGGGSGGAGYSEGMVEVAGSVSQGTASSGNQGVVDGSGDMNGTNDHVPGGSMGHDGENVAQETGNSASPPIPLPRTHPNPAPPSPPESDKGSETPCEPLTERPLRRVLQTTVLPRSPAISPESLTCHVHSLGPMSLALGISPQLEQSPIAHWPVSVHTILSTFRGPYILGPNTMLPTLVPASSSPPTPNDLNLRLELVGQRGHGALWDVYSAKLVPLRAGARSLIAKLTDMRSFAETRVDGYDSYTRSKAQRAVANEVRLFTGPLGSLQGKVVPRFEGLMGSIQQDGEQVWCAVYEDVGVELVPKEMFNPVIQQQIRLLYSTLHAAGVTHNDVEWRHVHRQANSIRLVDFDRAVARLPNEGDDGWNERCKYEMVAVEEMLRSPW